MVIPVVTCEREANKVKVMGIVGAWFITGITVCVCLCIILQERYSNSERYHHRALCRVLLACKKEMDPGRYGLQQGWDNNSVIVVSSLINHLYGMNHDKYKNLLGPNLTVHFFGRKMRESHGAMRIWTDWICLTSYHH